MMNQLTAIITLNIYLIGQDFPCCRIRTIFLYVVIFIPTLSLIPTKLTFKYLVVIV